MSDRGVGMHVRVFGGIEVFAPEPVALGGPTQRRTLALLLINVGEVVSLDRLIDGIWTHGDTPDRAEHNVQTYVHRLRSALDDEGGRIETVGAGYRLELDGDAIDAGRFERLVGEARAASSDGDLDRALARLDEALDLWRGRPYDDVADLDWAQAEVVRLQELRASAIERRFEVLLAEGRHTEVIGPLQEAVGEQPWREARRMQLALALYRGGRQPEALRAIQDYRSELADGLGLDPSPELAELEHRILDHDSSLLPASHQQHRLRGYELDEVIGEGAFSLVWRGTQPTLGRTVAVKQVRAELANEPDFVRRFETEAQTIAALEHPHIVPLYDYWREPDNAYLVMRYIAGGSLESEVLQGGLDDRRLRLLVDQVGSAIHTAHRVGVIHRDVKSANVLLDDDENFYLSDFGIAFTGSVADDELANALSTGSPAYASPEQLRRQELDHRTDIYGFGVTLFEAATGRLPFVDAPTQAAIVQRQLEDPVPAPSSVAATVPPWVDGVVARATAKNPADRYASMAELMAAVPPDTTAGVERARRPGPSAVVGELVNPFKALRAFREADAADFFGRDRLVARFVEVLAQPGSAGRVLAVVGPSGSGKSSAVRSGLLPTLRADAVRGSSDWFITTMQPGSRPFEELESALSRVAVRQPGPLVEMMRGDERGIARAVNRVLPFEDSELFLVIDQFEEMFTHAVDEERSKFLDGLLEAVREPRARLRVALTIRADFWDRPLRHPGLAARLETAAVTVPPLAADELEAAIVEPVRRQGAVYEPGLVARIIADVGDQPGALPLLQYALTELFDANVSGLIRSESYGAIGGLAGALAKRAEETLTAMSSDEQLIARRLFGRLVNLGEWTEDTRRRVRLVELGDGTEPVVRAYGEARLLVFDRDPVTREPTVEIAHEALLRAWPRLHDWLNEDRESLRIHRHLTDTTSAWQASGRDAGDLYRGGRLEAAAEWAVDHRSDLNIDEREFLDASTAAFEAEEVAEREHLEQQVRSNRRLRVLITIVTVVAVVAAVAGAFALRERNRARTSQAEADFERVLALARTTQSADPTVGLLLAVEADRFWKDGDSSPQRRAREIEGLNALHRALTARTGFEGWLGSEQVGHVTVLDDGERLVTHTADTIDVWNVATRTRETSWPFPRDLDRNVDVVFLATAAATDGSVVAASGPDGVAVLDLTSGDEVLRVERPSLFIPVAISPDHRRLAAGYSDGLVEVWDLGDAPRLVASLQRATQVSDVEWSPDGGSLAVGANDGSMTIWEPESGVLRWDQEPVAPSAPDNAALGFLFSSDGSRLVVSTQTSNDADGTGRVSGVRAIRVVDTSNGVDLVEPIVDEFNRSGMAWLDTAEETIVAVPSTVGPVTVFDVSISEVGTRRPTRELGATKTDSAWGIAAFQDLGIVATGGSSGIELRSMDGSGPLNSVAPLAPAQQAVRTGRTLLIGAFSADGREFVTSILAPTLPHVVDLEDPLRPAIEFGSVGDEGPSTVVDQFGHFTLHGTPAGFVVRRGLRGQALGPPIPFDPRRLGAVSLSHTGDRLMLDENDEVVLYDVASGERITALEPDVPFSEILFTNGKFSLDGSRLNTMTYFESASFDGETGELLWATDEFAFAFPLADGSSMATGEGLFDPVIRIRDAETLEEIADPLIGHQAGISWIELHPDGQLLATTGRDASIRVWDLDTSSQLGRELISDQAGVGIWSPDGTMLAVPTADGYDIWNYDTDSWVNVACEVAGRNLTRAEWDEFGPRTVDYRATCPQFPIEEGSGPSPCPTLNGVLCPAPDVTVSDASSRDNDGRARATPGRRARRRGCRRRSRCVEFRRSPPSPR